MRPSEKRESQLAYSSVFGVCCGQRGCSWAFRQIFPQQTIRPGQEKESFIDHGLALLRDRLRLALLAYAVNSGVGMMDRDRFTLSFRTAN